jgi:hypothetical protein
MLVEEPARLDTERLLATVETLLGALDRRDPA